MNLQNVIKQACEDFSHVMFLSSYNAGDTKCIAIIGSVPDTKQVIADVVTQIMNNLRDENTTVTEAAEAKEAIQVLLTEDQSNMIGREQLIYWTGLQSDK